MDEKTGLGGFNARFLEALAALRHQPAFEMAGHDPLTAGAKTEAEASELRWLRERTVLRSAPCPVLVVGDSALRSV